MFLPSLTSEMSLNIYFLLRILEKSILMGVCDVSLSILNKNPWEMFQINHKTMAIPILNITQTKDHLRFP